MFQLSSGSSSASVLKLLLLGSIPKASLPKAETGKWIVERKDHTDSTTLRTSSWRRSRSPATSCYDLRRNILLLAQQSWPRSPWVSAWGGGVTVSKMRRGCRRIRLLLAGWGGVTIRRACRTRISFHSSSTLRQEFRITLGSNMSQQETLTPFSF